MQRFLRTMAVIGVLAASICAGVWLARDRGGAVADAPAPNVVRATDALTAPRGERAETDISAAFEFAPLGELAPVSTRIRMTAANARNAREPSQEDVESLLDESATSEDATAVGGEEHPLFAMLRARDSEPVPAEIAELAAEITKDATNKLGKARAIYDWITRNIRYDVDEWMYVVGGGTGYSHEHDPASVLERGNTVCIGYAWLFDAMARSVGLDSTYLIGDSRGYRGTPEDEAASGFKHAWNAVAVDDGWALLDATWGAREVGEDDSTFLARTGDYFDTPPDQMIFDHLPESQEWQLLDNPVADADAFRDLPNLKPAFFENDIRIATPFSDGVAVKGGNMEPIIVQAGEGVLLAATVTTDGKTAQVPVLHSSNGNGLAAIAPQTTPPAGSVVRLYAKGPSSQWYECAADFVVE